MKETLEKLDFSKFDEKIKNYAFQLISILDDLSPERIHEHVELTKQAPDGLGDSEHFEQPSVYSLLAYGNKGLDSLYTLSMSGYDSGAWDAPVALLAVIFNRKDLIESNIYLSQRYLSEETYEKLKRIIFTNIDDPDYRKYAEKTMSKFVQSIVNDPTKRSELGTLLTRSSIYFTDKETQKSESIDFIIELLAKSSLNISEEICHQLKMLIDQELNESNYQKYFENFPALLDPLASSVIPTQNLGEMWKTDFVIKRLDDEYLFIEIEKPKDPLFTNYPQPSSQLSHALGQILNWFIWVEDNIAYAQSHGFPGIHSPKGIIVIGRNKDMSDSQIRMLKCLNDNLNGKIQIITYDDVLVNAQNLVSNLTQK